MNPVLACLQLTKQRAEEFYLEHYGKPFFKKLIDFMTSGPIYALILGKSNAIASWRELMGPTNSLKAKKEVPKRLVAIYSPVFLPLVVSLVSKPIHRLLLFLHDGKAKL